MSDEKREEWKRIQYKDIMFDYSISSFGRVMNHKGYILKTWLHGTRNGRYPCVHLCNKGTRITVDVHRLVALHFIPNPSGKLEVNHFDNNQENPRADNLEWCTREENEAHKRYMQAFKEVM